MLPSVETTGWSVSAVLSSGGEPILTLGKNDHQVQAMVFQEGS